MTRTSAGVSRCGDIRGQDDWSSSAHVSCRCQAWNRLGDSLRIPQERPQRNARAGLIDGAQDLPLGAAVWQPLPRQGESGGSVDGKHEPKQRRELLDASPEHADLMPEFRVRAGGYVKTDDDRGRPAEPPACRRTGDTEIPSPWSRLRCCRRDLVVGGHSAAAGGLCSACRESSAGGLTPFNSARKRRHRRRLPSGPHGDNSRRRVQNVRGDSSADFFTTEVWTWRGLVTYYTGRDRPGLTSRADCRLDARSP